MNNIRRAPKPSPAELIAKEFPKINQETARDIFDACSTMPPRVFVNAMYIHDGRLPAARVAFDALGDLGFSALITRVRQMVAT